MRGITGFTLSQINMKNDLSASSNRKRDPFQAVNDPTRRTILELLSSEPKTVTHIAKYFNVSRPAISKHIRILEECGVINIEKKGRERWCNVNYKSLKAIASWIMKFELYWVESFQRL